MSNFEINYIRVYMGTYMRICVYYDIRCSDRYTRNLELEMGRFKQAQGSSGSGSVEGFRDPYGLGVRK